MYLVSSDCGKEVNLGGASLDRTRRKTNLVEEHVFPIPSLGSKVFEVSILTDAVLLAQVLPELTAN